MRGLYDHGSNIAKVMKEGLQAIVGMGDRVRLWDDIELEGVCLNEAFPRIFALASNKVGCVMEYGSRSGSRSDSSLIWNIKLRRPCFNWEKDQWTSFRRCLDRIVIRDSISDSVGWALCTSGEFSVKSVWQNLEQREDGESVFLIGFGEVYALLRL